MKVFVAGATGAIGRFLLPRLLSERHEVTALVRNAEKIKALQAIGVSVAEADALDREALSAAIRAAQPEVIVHELTALKGAGNFKRLDQEFALTNRFRTEVLDTMLAAARAAGTRRLIAQSYCGWPFAREGAAVKTEADPLDPHPPASFRKTFVAIRYLEDTVGKASDLEALALRYGALYGPGTAIAKNGYAVDLVRARKVPIVGEGSGIWSFIHVEDAASATVAAIARGESKIYNVVDDDPAPVSAWLPALAEAVGAKAPHRLPEWLARFVMGDGGVAMMTRVRGGSNAKAKRELGWQPRYASWRRGFVEGLD